MEPADHRKPRSLKSGTTRLFVINFPDISRTSVLKKTVCRGCRTNWKDDSLAVVSCPRFIQQKAGAHHSCSIPQSVHQHTRSCRVCVFSNNIFYVASLFCPAFIRGKSLMCLYAVQLDSSSEKFNTRDQRQMTWTAAFYEFCRRVPTSPAIFIENADFEHWESKIVKQRVKTQAVFLHLHDFVLATKVEHIAQPSFD